MTHVSFLFFFFPAAQKCKPPICVLFILPLAFGLEYRLGISRIQLHDILLIHFMPSYFPARVGSSSGVYCSCQMVEDEPISVRTPIGSAKLVLRATIFLEREPGEPNGVTTSTLNSHSLTRQ